MNIPKAFPASPGIRPSALVQRLGRHPSHDLDLDLDDEEDATLGGWLLACCLLDSRLPVASAVAAFSKLRAAGLAEPRPVMATSAVALELCITGSGVPKPESRAALMLRVSRALIADYDGSVLRLVAQCDDLEAFGGRLTRLAPGFGRATVARFMRPLREVFSCAADMPLDPAALSAALHLGFVPRGSDEESAVGSLRALIELGEQGELDKRQGMSEANDLTQTMRDLEEALERLGRAACGPLRHGRSKSCPLGEDCPGKLEAGGPLED